MSNYTKTTDFEAKDSLPTGDSGKIIRGAEFETEFDAISTAIATKADTAGPTFTGTLTFETISDGTIGVTAFVDEDDMSSNSATLVPTQQSVKAYVDSQVTAQDLDFQADSGGALSIDLDSETLTFTGGTGIDTSGSGNAVTFAIDSTVATLTGSQTLTNKTLTSPVLNTGVSGTAVLDEDDMSSNSATQLATQQSIKAYVDSQVGANNELSEILANGNTTGGTNIVFGDSASVSDDRLVFGAGSDLQIYHSGTHSYIDDAGTGNLTLRGNASVRVEKYEGEVLADFAADGAVSLYHDNSVKIATTSTGVSVTGNVAVSGTVDGRDVATDGTKLDGIEASADVTDTANVTAAGALMDSELTSEASVKALNQGVATTDSPTFAGVTVNGTVEFDGLSGTGAVSVTDILDQDDMSSNSATALATQQSIKAYVDSQVATVDTLAEVLGNGNTTGGTDIAVGTGDDITFADSSKAIFGAGSDLQIYHDGSASYIDDQGTGSIIIKGTNFAVNNSANSQTMIAGNDGADVKLFYAGANKLATTSTGIDVTGTVNTDRMDATGTGSGVVHIDSTTSDYPLRLDGQSTTSSVFLGAAGNDFVTYAGGANRLLVGSGGDISFYEDTGTTAKLFWDASAERLGLGTSSPSRQLSIYGTNDGYMSFNGGRAGNHEFIVGTESSGFVIYDETLDTYRLVIDQDSGNIGIGTSSPDSALMVTDGSNYTLRIGYLGTSQNYIDVDTHIFRSANATERMRIDSSGNVGIGTSSPSRKLHVVGTSRPALIGSNNAVNYLKLYNSATGSSTYNGLDLLVNSTSSSQINTYGMPLTFGTSASNGTNVTERMRIDASGNLLVGKTASNIANAGLELLSDGKFNVTRNGNTVALFNRLTSDGTIAEFRKDGTTVGSINTNAGAFVFKGASASAPVQLQTHDGNEDIEVDPDGFIKMETAGSERLRIDSSGQIYAGASPQSIAKFTGRENGAAIEFGHGNNTAGYYGTAGSFGSAGYPYIGFSADAEASADTFTTRGFKGNLIAGDNTGALRFLQLTSASATGQNPTERARIDSSGNLLVGKTNNTLSNDGTVIRTGGEILVTNTNDIVANFNRTGTDGSIVTLYKDGTTVGSIGTAGGDIYLSNGTKSLLLTGSTVLPRDGTGGISDNTVDLGNSSNRFKDLYLSGTANVGGVTSDGAITINGSGSEDRYLEFGLDGKSSAFTGQNNAYIFCGQGGSGDFLAGGLYLQSRSATATREIGFITGTTPAKRMVISGAGNVGIGTDSPSYSLHVVGNQFNTGWIRANTGTAANPNFTIDGGAGMFKPTSNQVAFSTNSAERMRIDASGAVLVGATSGPTNRKFYVEAAVYPAMFRMTSSTVNYPTLQLRTAYATGGQTATQIDFRNGADATVGTVKSTVNATSYNTSSDQRLKENIVDAPSASDDIDAIQVRSFDWKADGSHQKYGMVAQELQSVAPEAVTGDADSDDMMGVDYSKLVPMLVKEIQSLRARVAQLEGEN